MEVQKLKKMLKEQKQMNGKGMPGLNIKKKIHKPSRASYRNLY